MSTREPYVNVSIADASQAPVYPSENGLNIVSFIASPTGPVAPTKISSPSELIDKFLVNDKVLSSDHTTIKHGYKLLRSTPITFLRVDTSELLTGIDDKGDLLFFDKNYQLIDNLTQVDIDALVGFNVAYLVDTINNTVYYVGDVAELPVDYDAFVKREISTSADLDLLFPGLNKIADTNLIIGRNFLSNLNFGSINTYMAGATKRVLKSAFKRIRVATPSFSLAEGDFVTIGAKDYYVYVTGLVSVNYDNTPVPVTVLNSRAPTILEFMAHVFDLLCEEDQPLISGMDMAPTVVVGGMTGTPTIEGTAEILAKIKSTAAATQMTIKGYYSHDLMSDQYIVLIDGSTKYVFFNGTQPTVAGTPTYINLGAEAMSVYKFLVQLSIKADAHTTLTGSISAPAFDMLFKKNADIPLAFSFTGATTQASVYEDTSTDVLYEYSVMSNADYEKAVTYEDLYVKVDTTVFFIGDYVTSGGETLVRVGASPMTLNNFLEKVYQNIPTYFDGSRTNTGFMISGVHVVTASMEIDVDVIDIIQDPVSKFAVVQKYSSQNPIFRFSYAKQVADPSIYDFTININGSESVYEMSFDPTKVNGQNINIYYLLINSSQDDVQVVLLNEDADTFSTYTSRLYGNDVWGSANPTSADFIRTASKLLDLEDFYPTILFDGGLMDPLFFQYLVQIGTQLHAMVPIGTPASATTKASIKAFRDACGVDNFRAKFHAPAHWDVVGDFSAIIGPHLYYIERVVSNYNSVSNEFAPTFGKSKGVVFPGAVPVCEINKEDREYLLDSQINYIVKSQADDTWFFNQNLTGQVRNSQLSEDQTARMALIISQITDQYMKTVIAEFNTDETRSQIVQALTSLIEDRCVRDKRETLVDYVIQCDKFNNTDTLIDQRKIKVDIRVQFRRSIAYVEVVNKIYGLTGNIR